MNLLIAKLVAGVLLAGTVLASLAQPYPERPIRLIVPWPPGGSADAIGRLAGNALSAGLGKPVIVENMAGASGNVATQQFVRNAKPDGYTLILATSSTNAANPHLFAKLGFEPLSDFEPISLVALSPSILIVAAASPFKSPQDIVDAARAKPGKLSFGSGGTGNSGHLSGELFKSIMKIDAQHVPYRGNSPALVDLMGGQIDYMFDNGAVPNILGGKVRALAVASDQRLQVLPSVPTFKELGWPAMQLSTWFGLAAPKGTPKPIVDKLNAVMNSALQSPELTKRLQDMGAEVRPLSAAAYAAFWKDEIDRYRDVVRISGAKLE